MGASTPTATACWPRGLSTSHSVSLVPSDCPGRSWLRSRSGVVARSIVRIFPLPFPEVDRSGLRLPHLGAVDAGQAGKRAILGAERDVLVGLGHHRRLASDRIANHAEAVLGAD